MKYVCNQKKEDIINIIVEEFEIAKNDFENSKRSKLSQKEKDRNFGRYIATIDLLQKIKIEIQIFD